MGRRVAMGLLIGFSCVVAYAAVRAAPLPPPHLARLAQAIAIAVPPKESSLTDYVNLFAEDIVVLDDDKQVASTRPEFLSYLRARTGLHVKVLQLSYGNPILVAEEVDNFREPRPDVVQDCCFWARLASYHFGPSGLVDRVLLIGNEMGWASAEALKANSANGRPVSNPPAH